MLSASVLASRSTLPKYADTSVKINGIIEKIKQAIKKALNGDAV
jgi:hypothetical protein